jgi:hypothetical protein
LWCRYYTARYHQHVEHLKNAENKGSETPIDANQAVVQEVVPITASGQLIGQLKQKRKLEAAVVCFTLSCSRW